MFIVGGIGIRYGRPQRLVYGSDYRGKVCGVDEGVADKKYTAYPRTTEDFLVNVGKRNPADYKFYGASWARAGGEGGWHGGRGSAGARLACSSAAPLAGAPV